jgi:hypothetical protein
MKKIHPILQILFGFILADLIAGTFHWFEDCYLDYCSDIPILRDIAKDNEMHHYFPRTMISYSYLENMTYTLPFAIVFLCVWYILSPKFFVRNPYFIVTLFVFMVLSNLIHRFSHMRDCENHTCVKLLQKCGIFCSHEHHSLHHRLSNEKYCVITEYNNYILDTLLFWRGLEYMIFLFTGISPTRKQGYDDYIEIHNHMHENAKLKCPDKPTAKDVKELEQKLKEYKICIPK